MTIAVMFVPLAIIACVTETAEELIARLMFKHKLRARRRRHFI